jgi:hypothetical protein
MKRSGKQLAITAVFAALVIFGAIGCGSSESDSSTSAPLTKAQFLKEGNRICQARLEEKDKVVADALKELSSSEAANPSQSTFTELGERVLEPVRQMAEELSELDAPASAEAKAATITRQLEAGVKQAESNPSTLVKANPLSKAGESARAYGLKACNF